MNDLERKVPWRSDEMIGLMDAAIARIERLAGNGDCQRIAGGQTLRVSDSDQRVVSLKTRLGQTGLLRGSPGYFGSPSFDERLETAIRGFQDQMGLRATSRLDRATLTQLNVPPEVRLAQLRLNRRRIQDLLRNPVEDRHVFVNAAAFRLEAVERYQVRRRHRIVVGKPDRQTPAINASIRGLNFFPSWHVPDSIAQCDVIPRLRNEPDMMSLISPSTEPLIRLSVFAVGFAAMALWEVAAPRRRQAIGRALRWPSNLAIVVLDTAFVRLLFPLSSVALAMHAETRGWGLLHHFGAPVWLAAPIAFLLLDFAIYLQHVAFHAVPALWRLHRMHHADLEFDVTTGSRFHPIEIVLSMIIKLAIVAALGVPAVAIFAFEVVLNATAMFNHSNVRLPVGADRVLRWLVVTPDMHRVHHSILVVETNANFGFNLPWWDRLFGTYRDQPADGHEAMTIGVAELRNQAELRLDRMLTQPFRVGDEPGPVERQPTAGHRDQRPSRLS